MQSGPKTVSPLCGTIEVPGDKSITHRALMFSSLAEGRSTIATNLMGRDNLATLRIMRQLGVRIDGALTPAMLQLAVEEGVEGFSRTAGTHCEIVVHGRGLSSLTPPSEPLDCGNSGTTARLLTGILAGCPFSATLTGDESLVKRPFKRVTEPLSQMGARFSGEMLPLTIDGGSLNGIDYASPKASAQVKSAIVLAGLRASGKTSVLEPSQSRDHTERMLAAMGCLLQTEADGAGGWRVTLPEAASERVLTPLEVLVPGDFSAAAFFLVLGAIVPHSRVRIKNVGMNPTRDGLKRLLERMGAKIETAAPRVSGGEEVADLTVSGGTLRGIEVGHEEVVLAIDEIPVLAVAAACAEGDTIIRGAEELRVKESDRLTMTASVLRSFGVEVDELPDGLHIRGKSAQLGSGAERQELFSRWQNSGDHRIAMSAAVLQYATTGCFAIGDRDQKAVETSFPNFVQCFQSIIEGSGGPSVSARCG